MKTLQELLIGSPALVIQIVVIVLILFYSIRHAYIEFADQSYLATLWSISTVLNFLTAIVSMVQVFLTEPGQVTPALIDKIKN